MADYDKLIKHNMKKLLIQWHIIHALLCAVLLSAVFACTQNTAGEIQHDNELLSEKEFLSPPDAYKPWVYYWWLKGNVSKELITRDLEEMHNKGIGGFLLFDSRGYWDDFHGRTGHIPVPLEIKHEFMSPEWREMVKFTMQEANRLGLKMSINLANTGGSLRGPWNMKDDGPKQLIWTAADVTGPQRIETRLHNPSEKRYFNDITLIAVRMKPGDKHAKSQQSINLNGEWSTVSPPSE